MVSPSGSYLVIQAGADEPLFRPTYRLEPNGDSYAVYGPAKLHQFLRFGQTDWDDAPSPLPAAVQRIIDALPAASPP